MELHVLDAGFEFYVMDMGTWVHQTTINLSARQYCNVIFSTNWPIAM